MQAFIERIDIFPERQEDGNWIQNIKFQFPVLIIKEGKEVAQIKGISLDKEKSDEHMISLEKLSTLETIVLLSQHRAKSTCLDERGSRQIEMQASRLASLLAQKPDDTIEIDLDLDELDATSAEPKATYQEIKDYVLKEFGLKVSNLYISQIKRKCGIEVGENYNLPSRTKNPVCSAFVFIRGQRRSKLQFYSK